MAFGASWRRISRWLAAGPSFAAALATGQCLLHLHTPAAAEASRAGPTLTALNPPGTAASLGVSCGISMRAGPISAAGKPKSAAEVIHTEDFKRAVLEREGDVLVEVFSPTCTACKALAPRLFAALQLARGSSDVPPLSLVQIVSNWAAESAQLRQRFTYPHLSCPGH